MTHSFITTIFYAMAIAHALTDRIIAPFLQSIFAELVGEAPVSAGLSLAVADVKPTVKAPVKSAPRPARRRKPSAKSAA